MPKALKTAALVVGAAALIATGVGAAATVGLLGAAATTGTIAGIATATTLTTIGSLAGAASALAMAGAQVATPKGTVGGNPTKYKIDKDAGIPIVFGRTSVGGNVVHRQYYDDPASRMRNQRESWVTALSLGPVKSIGPLMVDKVAVTFDANGAAIGSYAGNMWLDTQLGACPETRALRGPTGNFPGWDATSKLSGLAADLWTLDYDSKGVKYPNGIPQRARVVEGVFVWDPRLDDTYPGGMGPCRRDDPSTHVYSENPWLLDLQFALGFRQNGHLMAGGGMAPGGVDVNAFVQAANVADENEWVAGGQAYTTSDNDWDVLKMLAQAGGGEVMTVAGTLSCLCATPRVSIGTITSEDIIGDLDVPSTASMRKRRNTVIPRVRLEAQGWEVVPLQAVSVPEYVTLDGAPRPREIEYPLVQNAKQGAQLAMYDMLNDRELDGIVLPCSIAALGYLPGDCLTLNIPEANLINRQVVLRTRELDGGSLGVTFTARTEDAAKHGYALGAVGVPPRTPDLSIPSPDTAAPSALDWNAAGTTLTAGGVSIPALIVSGAAPRGNVEAVVFDFRVHAAGQAAEAGWIAAGSEVPTVARKELTGVTPGTSYDVSVRYRIRGLLTARLILGPATSGDFGTPPAERAAYQIVSRSVAYPITSDDNSVIVTAFTGVLDDGRSIAFPAADIAAGSGITYGLFYDLSAGTYSIVASPALAERASPAFAFLGWSTTSSGGTYPTQPTPPPGWGGNGQYVEQAA
ncbi:hypothetical protein [Sphingomonas sp. Leaf4]|uniref:hypothetical protein n=1 Tax=Sphingomonas sp. Leaf4 TaxID=2876553 RepID=UPI001E2C0D89|nr:hypothetical protein [Sphingomonas sp. Leaf4]